MKRPRFWLRWLLLFCAALIFFEYAALTWYAPGYVVRFIRRLTRGELAVDSARLSPALTTLISGIRSIRNSQNAALSIQSVLIRPGRLSVAPLAAGVQTIEVDRLFVRASRDAAGTVFWPAVSTTVKAKPGRRLSWLRRRLRLRVDNVRINEGVLEWIDVRPKTSFHLAVDPVTVNIGPITLPNDGEEVVSFAVRGRITGYEGRAAPAYCSGWVNLKRNDLDFSCQLKPLPLAVFDPYFQEHPVIRVYNATVAVSSQWTAKANQLDARIHLELDHLDEGDVSVRGLTLINMKKLAKAGERKLIAEVGITGPLDDPNQWQAELIPGNEPAKLLFEQLLERRITMVSVPLGGKSIGMRVALGSPAAMEGMQAVSKSVAEALEILATPLEPEAPPVSPTVPAAPAAAEGQPQAAPEAAAVETPAPVSPQPQVEPPSAVVEPQPQQAEPPPAAAEPAPAAADPAASGP